MRAIRPGGLFAGQLFGPNDGFLRESPAGSMNAHSRDAVDRLLAPFDVLSIAEEERDGVIGAPPNERAKHWHVFHVVARRRARPSSRHASEASPSRAQSAASMAEARDCAGGRG